MSSTADQTIPGTQPTSGGPGDAPSRWRRYRLFLVVSAVLVVILAGLYAVSSHNGSPAAFIAPSAAAGRSAGPIPATSGAPASPTPGPSVQPSPAASKKKPAAAAARRPGGRPGASNTGVPAGTALSAYDGPCTITRPGTVIDARTVGCDLDIRAADVTIKRSKVNGSVLLDTDVPGSSKWSYLLVDSEVDAGKREHPAVSYGNMTVLRSNVHGGITSVQCGEKAITCTVEDSWLHGQRIGPTDPWHLGGFLSNGGRNIRIRHNTIICDPPANRVGEGCTGDLNLLGDFAPIQDVIVEDNFLGANTGSSFCLYGGDAASKPYPHANHVVVRDNVFERGTNGKCGDYGPVSSFNTAGPGNVWSNNTWQGGGTVAGVL